VVEVSASFVDGKAVVKLDTTLTKIDKISETVSSRGYAVTGHKVAEKTE
jgi:copper chaperone CopZ